MNIILSKKAAEKLRKEFDLDVDYTSTIDNWRVDHVALGKRSIFIVTNEQTLYTCISSCKSGFNGIVERLASVTNQQDIDVNEINYLKSQNKSLVSSMNNIKNLVGQLDRCNRRENKKYEELINQIPFEYLSFRTPNELFFREIYYRAEDYPVLSGQENSDAL
jgi:hypothetical protein